ncbi:insulinase family protein [Patescibacteria group bacterium]|nr:insulinase family protein [Patescibacteria group bacterium]MCL5409504.1 insulinase family protein [Patescibacteria group bacterium]
MKNSSQYSETLKLQGFKLHTLKNGLTLITVELPHLESVTTLLAVGAGSRYETKQNNGISHFLEHMFFKGSKKYPSAEIIANIVDGIGAVNNAATNKEYTYYWIKSAAQQIDTASQILSSMAKESLLDQNEIDQEKGVITEEIRMYRDIPQRYVFDLYERLQYGDQPLGWDIAGDEKIVNSFKRADFVDYVDSLYAPENMVLVLAGKLPKDVLSMVEKYYNDLPKRAQFKPPVFQKQNQQKPQINVYQKKTDQANIILGVQGFGRTDSRRHAADLLGVILGEGMSSRLFIQVRERRGLAYHVSAGHDSYLDTGSFVAFAGLKIEKVEEGIKVIREEMLKLTREKVEAAELTKAKEMLKGRIAIRSESTNFLAEYVGTNFVLDRKLETPDDYLSQIKQVTAEELLEVAQQLFKSAHFNLQVIGPFDQTTFANLLS